jgi:hypothetical protein
MSIEKEKKKSKFLTENSECEDHTKIQILRTGSAIFVLYEPKDNSAYSLQCMVKVSPKRNAIEIGLVPL